MGVKKVLKDVGKVIAWPFVHLVRALFSPRGQTALKLAYQQMLKTVLGAKIDQFVRQYATMGTLTSAEKFAAALQAAIAFASGAKLEWKESLIRLGIELAVQALKNGWK